MTNRIRKIVIGGVFSALVIVLGISGLGFIMLPIVSITILQAPVIIAAILEGPLVGFFIGLLFGIFSIVQAALAGSTPVDMAFLHYPWLALIPRVLIGPAAWLIYSLLSGSFFNSAKKISPVRESIAISMGAVAGSFINTALVLSGLVLLREKIAGISEFLIWGSVALNGLIEAAFSVGISLAVILPWKGISRRGKSKLNSAENSEW
jgi:uncharacterized membrane protein